MAKTYKKISGTWYPIKKIYKRISGAWSEVKKLYKKVSGTWQVVHSSVYEYTFTANASNVDFATLIGASAVANNTDFKITINSGVMISGTDGVAGANNTSKAYLIGNVVRACLGTDAGAFYYPQYFTGNGGNGGNGNIALSFAGMSGKNITIVNNGTIRGGNGGSGGCGASDYAGFSAGSGAAKAHITCGISGSAGSGNVAIYNPNGNAISISANSPINGSSGIVNIGYFGVFNSTWSCFPAGQKVLMYDGTNRNIEDVKVGEQVMGAFGEPNVVDLIQKPLRGNRIIYDVLGLLTTDEHDILNGERDGFYYLSMASYDRERNTWQDCYDKDGKIVKILCDGLNTPEIKMEDLVVGVKICTLDGAKKVDKILISNREDKHLYHLVTSGGSTTYSVNGVFVAGHLDADSFLKYAKN